MANSTLPQKLFRAEQVRLLDAVAIHKGGIPGIQLMKRAGRAAFDVLLQMCSGDEQILVFCGGGNNGGDGYIIAALAAQQQLPVQLIAVCDPARLRDDALLAYQFAVQEGVPMSALADRDLETLLADSDAIVVDAMLGTGLQGSVRDDYAAVITAINDSSARVLAVDIPSGLSSDFGQVLGCAVRATKTVTFIGCKRGLFTAQAPAYSGEILFADLDVYSSSAAEALAAVEPDCLRIGTGQLRPLLAERQADDHKGRYGHVMVIGGDSGFGGAAALAAEACLCSGAGLTSVATRPCHVSPILSRLPEVMVNGIVSGQELEPLLKRPSVLVIGPGLGQSPWSEQLLQQVAATGLPAVIDADALNIMAQQRAIAIQPRANWVYTPHPGEAARLLGCSVADIQADRFVAVKTLQQMLGGVVLLKGAGTLINDGQQTYLANVGNPGMATGGMGDVLAGVIASLIAQGMSAVDAVCLGACVHGDAADCVADQTGMRGIRASELIPFIRELLN